MADNKLRYVPLEIEAMLGDADFQIMNAEQRGVYLTLILYLYANNGKCRLDSKQIGELTRCDDFENVWQKIQTKFQVKGDYIKHKKVTKELRKAKRLMQAKRKGGLMTAKKKQLSCSTPESTPISTAFKIAIANKNKNTREYKRNVIGEGEEKTSYTNTNYEFARALSTLTSPTRALRFYDDLVALIEPRDKSDETSFRKISNWLAEQCENGKFNEKIFKRALDYAKEAKNGRNPAALFTSLMQKELKYNENNTADTRSTREG